MLLVHIPLGYILRAAPALGQIHAFAVLGYGVFCALNRRIEPQRALLVAAYIVGAEVLWRMTGAYVIWEYGKYSITVILFLTIFRVRNARIPQLPLTFFLLLLPSCLLTLSDLTFDQARSAISSNLSAHLTFLLLAWYLSKVTISKDHFKHLFFLLIGPILSVAAIAATSILSSDIAWTSNSNLEASGGYGPNQVSAILGLGALAIWLLFVSFPMSLPPRVILGVLALWLIAQALLTFSRGGIFNAAVPAAFLVGQSLFQRRQRRFASLILIVGAVAYLYVVFPQLDELTGGALQRRFSDQNLTGRDIILQSDLEIFADNVLWGVGPGMSVSSRLEYADFTLGHAYAAHTEYTRMLSEHGLLGLTSLALLAFMLWTNYRRTKTDFMLRSIVIAMGIWGLVFMAHSATRIAAAPFALGITFVYILPEVKTERR